MRYSLFFQHCLVKAYRLIDKEINNTCNEFKGHGEQCHVFCEKWFSGRVKIPITRVLCGARFDGIFEAFVGNFWKWPDIMKWLVYVLEFSKNYSCELDPYFSFYSCSDEMNLC